MKKLLLASLLAAVVLVSGAPVVSAVEHGTALKQLGQDELIENRRGRGYHRRGGRGWGFGFGFGYPPPPPRPYYRPYYAPRYYGPSYYYGPGHYYNPGVVVVPPPPVYYYR